MRYNDILQFAIKFEKLAQEEDVWALVHDTYEPEGVGIDYPVVRHIFIGKSKEEAQGYFDSHLKTDEFFAKCEKDGKWEEVECNTKRYWEKMSKKDFDK